MICDSGHSYTHGDLIVLPYWEFILPAPGSNIPVSQIISMLSIKSFPYPSNSMCQVK